jgi:HPt (histidine-containing phosphotransfer) domain-containing protein
MNADPPRHHDDPTSTGAGDSPPPRLDEQALGKLRELDPDGRHGVVVKVLTAFEKSLEQACAEMAAARDAGDLGKIGQLAHKLRSSSASVGALALSAVCGEVERQVRDGETSGLMTRVAQFLTEAGRVQVAVRAILRP